MASQLYHTIRILAPRIPLIIKTAILNLLCLSPNSSKQDLITEVTVALVRSIMSIQTPLLRLQKLSQRDSGITGPMWISKASIPVAPDETESQALLNLLNESILSHSHDEKPIYTVPLVAEVTGEWTGYRHNVSSHASRPQLSSEVEHYTNLVKETTSPLTILYFHGGAYFLMDPASHRGSATHMAKLTGGKVFSVRYRLAPQSPFPAQLLDAFISYLYLLSPPEGSFHDPIPASQIIFAGDSAGGNLALALTQYILTLKRNGHESITFHGHTVPLEVPGGVALFSPWADISRALPSIRTNARYDYLIPPSATGFSRSSPIPPDPIWPASPPRAELFCNANLLTNPLVSPVTSSSKHWQGAPPLFMSLGSEALQDEICLVARRYHQAGSIVHLVGYDGQPHCFAMVLRRTARARDCFARTARFCLEAVEGTVKRLDYALWCQALSKPLRFEKVPLENSVDFTDQEAEDLWKTAKDRAVDREADLVQQWREQRSRAKL